MLQRHTKPGVPALVARAPADGARRGGGHVLPAQLRAAGDPPRFEVAQPDGGPVLPRQGGRLQPEPHRDGRPRERQLGGPRQNPSGRAVTRPLDGPRGFAAGELLESLGRASSFAVVLWEIRTLSVPWAQSGQWQVMHAVVEEGRRPEMDEPPRPSFAGIRARSAHRRRLGAGPERTADAFEMVILSVKRASSTRSRRRTRGAAPPSARRVLRGGERRARRCACGAPPIPQAGTRRQPGRRSGGSRRRGRRRCLRLRWCLDGGSAPAPAAGKASAAPLKSREALAGEARPAVSAPPRTLALAGGARGGPERPHGRGGERAVRRILSRKRSVKASDDLRAQEGDAATDDRRRRRARGRAASAQSRALAPPPEEAPAASAHVGGGGRRRRALPRRRWPSPRRRLRRR